MKRRLLLRHLRKHGASSKEKAESTLYGLIPKQELLKQCQDILKSPISSPRKSVEGFLFLIRDAVSAGRLA